MKSSIETNVIPIDQSEDDIENYEKEKQHFIEFMEENAVRGELTYEQIIDSYDRKITKAFLNELVKDGTLEEEERDGETYYSLKEETLGGEPLEDFEQIDQAA